MMSEWIIKARGLPWSCTEEQLHEFFGLGSDGISAIHFVNNRDGRPSGEAYVVCTNESAQKTALLKDRENMGHRYIEVLRSTEAEMASAIKSRGLVGGELSNRDGVVRLRGMPFGCTRSDVQQFFAGLTIAPNGIVLQVDQTGKSTGGGYVQFDDPDSVPKALEKHMKHMDTRYIEVFRSSKAEFNRCAERNRGGVDMGAAATRGGMMRGGGAFDDGWGAPRMASGAIRPSPYARPADPWGDQRWAPGAGGDRMQEYGVDAFGDEWMLVRVPRSSPFDRPSQDRLADTVGDRRLAMGADRSMGYDGEREQLDRRSLMGGAGGYGAGGGGSAVGGAGRYRGFEDDDMMGYGAGGRMRAAAPGLDSYSAGWGGGGAFGGGLRSRGGMMGGAAGYDSYGYAGGRVPGGAGIGARGRGGMMGAGAGVRPKTGAGGALRGGDKGAIPDRHIIKMRGLPFDASETDIELFFKPLLPVNIDFRIGADGRPSGEALVEFSTHSEALTAMKKDREHIGRRYVELFMEGGGAGMAKTKGKMAMGGGGAYRDFSSDDF